MQNRKWLYYIIDEFGRSYRIENGLIVAKSDPKPLRYTPDGWQDISIAWERDLETAGNNRNFSLPYGFVRDGLDILREIFYTKNFEFPLYLLLKKQELYIDNVDFYFWHKYFYKGQLDLSSMKDEDNKATIEILEGKLHKDMEANRGTKFEIPVDVPESIIVKMDGIDLLNKASFLISGEVADPSGGNGYFPMIYVNSDGVLLDVQLNTSLIQWRVGEALPDMANDHWFLDNPSKKIINISFESLKLGLKTQYIGGGPDKGFSVIVRKYNPTTDADSPYTGFVTLFSVDAGPGMHTLTEVNLTGSISVAPGERLVLIYKYQSVFDGLTGPGNGSFVGNKITFFEQYFNVTSFSRFDPTYIRVHFPLYVFKKLIEKITGNSVNGESALLNKWKNLTVTCGDAIRGISGSAIKITYDDFYTSVDAVLAAGYGIVNGKVILEDKSAFFVNSNPIHLGKIKEQVVSIFKEILCNTIEIGYPNQDYKDVNGKQEFNTKNIYSTPIKSVVKKLEKVSIIRADPFGIESLRVNMEAKTTTDNDSDNDVFFINVDIDHPQVMTEQIGDFPAGTVYYNLARETYDTIEGLFSPDSMFNIKDLTPARLVKRHEQWIRSIFHSFEGDYLRYETSDKNDLLKTVKGSEIFDEDADIPIISLKNPLLIPRAIDFKTMTPVDLVDIMEANPNRCFSLEHPNGKIYKGFNIKAAMAPNTLEEQAFQLVFTPDTDITTLRNGK